MQNTIIDVKKAECFYDGHPGDLLYNATQELIDLAKENKALTKGTLLEPYRDRIINTFTNHKPSLADMNISPKEAVMIYIYLED